MLYIVSDIGVINMKGFNKWKLYIFSLVSSLVITSFTSLTVNAASVYDSAYRYTNSVTLFNPDLAECTGVDITYTWGQLITDNQYWYNDTIQATASQSFTNAINNGGYWGVTEATTETGAKTAYVYWQEPNETTPLNVEFAGSGSTGIVKVVGSNIKYLVMAQSDNIGSGIDKCDARADAGGYNTNTSGFLYLSNAETSTGMNYKNLFLKSPSITYPVGYEGLQIRSSYDQRIFSPDFDVVVKDMTVSLNNTSPKVFDTNKSYLYETYIVDVSSNQTIYTFPTLSSQAIETQQFQFEQEGSYMVYIQPYEDVLAGQQLPDDVALQPRGIQLTIDGSSSYAFNTRDLDCNTDGSCPAYSPLEDCAEYGTDVVGGIGCQFRNFGTWIKNIIVDFLWPDTDKIITHMNSTITLVQTKLGFLTYPFEFFTRFTSQTLFPETTCNLEVGEIFGTNYTHSFCPPAGWESQWNFALSILRAGVLFLLLKAFMDRRSTT